MKNKLFATVLLLSSTSVLANIAHNTHKYQQTQIEIQNNTSHIKLINIYNFEGTWKKPVTINTPFILEPNASYKNILVSVNNGENIKNNASIEVSQVQNPRENYLIFGEATNSRRHSISAHIFDGLGFIFTDSWTNHCDEKTSQGYANCKLVIQNQN